MRLPSGSVAAECHEPEVAERKGAESEEHILHPEHVQSDAHLSDCAVLDSCMQTAAGHLSSHTGNGKHLIQSLCLLASCLHVTPHLTLIQGILSLIPSKSKAIPVTGLGGL
jgi:hypothetical protein